MATTDVGNRHESAEQRFRWRGQYADNTLWQRLCARWRRIAWAALLGSFLVLLAILVYLLLYAPKRTPLVTINGDVYKWPLPPHAWSQEDLDGLAELDGKTISMVTLDPIRKSSDVLAAFTNNQLLTSSAPHSETVIIYVTMHGVVNADGDPCLVPTDASPLQPDTWLTLNKFLEQLGDDPNLQDKNTLVVLDCNRIDVNWNLGLIQNDFAASLQQLWDSSRADSSWPRKLAILNSAGSGQRGWACPDLRGSVFGHYFKLGLAGDADSKIRDRNVSLLELEEYVKTRVEGWVRHYRDDSQQPMLLRPPGLDFRLTSSLNQQALKRLIAFDANATRRAARVTPDDRDALWEQLDKLRNRESGPSSRPWSPPYEREPLHWRELEHKLIWLEALAGSGIAYGDLATQTLNELQVSMANVATKLADTTGETIRDYGLLAETEFPIPSDLKVHSLPLSVYFDKINAPVAAGLRDKLQSFLQEPTAEGLDAVLRAFDDEGLPVELVEQRFFHMLKRYQYAGLWGERSELLKQLLETRQTGERIAVPTQYGLAGTERAHAWVQSFIDSGDEDRRLAEDALFADLDDHELDLPLRAARQKYEEARRTADILTKAYATRDWAWAETLYLAQWLTHPSQAPSTLDAENSPITKLLWPLIQNAKALSDDLNPPRPTVASSANTKDRIAEPRATIAKIKAAEASVTSTLEDLKHRLDSSCRQLTNDANNKAMAWRRIEAILQLPLISVNQRSALRDRQALLADELRSDFLDPAPEADSNRPPRTVSFRDWRRSWKGDHPLRRVLDEFLATDGEQLALPKNDYYGGQLLRVSELLELEREVTDRGEWSRREQVVRAAAPVWFPLPTERLDPVREITSLDLQQLLLWRARRSLDDLWGRAGRPRMFFDVATDSYLCGAEALAAENVPSEHTRLRAKLDTMRTAVDNWFVADADDAVLMEPGDDVATRVSLSPARGASDIGVVNGLAGLITRRDGSRLPKADYYAGDTPRKSISMADPIQHDLRLTIAGDPDLPRGAEFQTELIFRGHEFPGPFHVRDLGGLVIDFKPHVRMDTRVTLHRHRPTKKLACVFVLDCSNSMRNHLDEAKQALQDSFEKLADRGQVRVGLVLFGHRVGWTTDEPLRKLIQPGYTVEEIGDLDPNEDVKVARQVAELRFEDLGTLQAQLGRVGQAWGQSPLYRAVNMAVESLAEEDAETLKQVIVISDGRDYQFPNSNEQQDLARLSLTVQKVSARIHVLATGSDRQDALRAIQGGEQGEVATFRRSQDLADFLKRMIEPTTVYSMTDAANQEYPSQLGTPILHDLVPDRQTPQVATVNFRDLRQKVPLEGGEAVDLFVTADRSAMRAFPYRNETLNRASLVGAADWIARAHRPIRRGNNVVFSLSLQRREPRVTHTEQEVWRVSPRPRECWIEIKPASDAGEASQPYIFYDTNYEPDKPVPVLDWMARGWPTTARRARIRLWCRFAATKPTATIDLTSLVRTRGTMGPPLRRQIGGVSLQVDTRSGLGTDKNLHRIRVVERHDREETFLPLRVDEPRLDPPQRPVRIIRQFDAAQGVVVHSFLYEAGAGGLQVDQAELAITTAEAAKENALQLDSDYLETGINDAGELLNAAGG